MDEPIPEIEEHAGATNQAPTAGRSVPSSAKETGATVAGQRGAVEGGRAMAATKAATDAGGMPLHPLHDDGTLHGTWLGETSK